MSIKHALLALLSDQPRTANGLKQEFHKTTGDTQPLNMGQVSQTLSRLERDGLIAQVGVVTGPSGHQACSYQITDSGRSAVQAWFSSPVEKALSDRDELVTKIAFAVHNPQLDVIEILDTQRNAILSQLRVLNKQAREVAQSRNPQRLVIERRIFDLEAEARWLDRVESLKGAH
ncbi:MAG: PadR family transcriptional regulator [Corynebacterium sp.]|uniref:PadR family transcriptional regulator n=1 Tax=Corynebacterium sp. TaxID=1720 RepID=UPI0026DC1714|nr:PadR family transcriptional regulator [Corynebacterium sp.]MDO4762059.1 PadR family transcriptional regulator [Corynebacterium sp.]